MPLASAAAGAPGRYGRRASCALASCSAHAATACMVPPSYYYSLHCLHVLVTPQRHDPLAQTLKPYYNTKEPEIAGVGGARVAGDQRGGRATRAGRAGRRGGRRRALRAPAARDAGRAAAAARAHARAARRRRVPGRAAGRAAPLGLGFLCPPRTCCMRCWPRSWRQTRARRRRSVPRGSQPCRWTGGTARPRVCIAWAPLAGAGS